MYYIRVEAVGFSVRNHPPLPPAMNTMNFRFSHATCEKAPTSQWRQCGAFAPHWSQGKVVGDILEFGSGRIFRILV